MELNHHNRHHKEKHAHYNDRKKYRYVNNANMLVYFIKRDLKLEWRGLPSRSGLLLVEPDKLDIKRH